MRFRISPVPQIAIGAFVKDETERLQGCETELLAEHHCGDSSLLPYEELLEDAMEGKQTWFAREDYVEESWELIDPILKNPPKPLAYDPGTWGPDAAAKLVDTPGGWVNPS